MRIAAAAAILFLTSEMAHAGAWTLPKGTTQIISMSTISAATRGYDAAGSAKEPVSFHKSFVSLYAEYGWNDWLTLIAIPEYADATYSSPSRLTEKARDFAIGAGARVRIFNDWGALSLEALARSAGAFELDTSFRQKPGEDFEVRTLYATHFDLFGRDGCVDLQIAQRWTTGGRPDETPVDLSLMYDIGWKSQVLVQTFNVISEGSGQPPFGHYRYHKLALSLVRPIWGNNSLQLGVFTSPAGQNALKEQGAFVSIWTKF